jgi:hypothetical protein
MYSYSFIQNAYGNLIQGRRRALAQKSLFLILLGTSAHFCSASDDSADVQPSIINFPVLPGSTTNDPAYIEINKQHISMGDETSTEAWNLIVEGYEADAPSLSMDKGWALTNNLTAGGTLTYQKGFSEFFLNSIFNVQRNLRLKLAVGQMRSEDTYLLEEESHSEQQNSYFLSLNKKWRSSTLLPEAEIGFYSVQSKDTDAKDLPSTAYPLQDEENDLGKPGNGSLNGSSISILIVPTKRSHLELFARRENLTQRYLEGIAPSGNRSLSGFNYFKTFRDCSKGNARFSTGNNFTQLEFQVQKQRWEISFLSSQTDEFKSNEVQVNYTIPLGRESVKNQTCDATAAPTLFEEPLDAAIARPEQIPAESVAAIDATQPLRPLEK